MTAVAGRSVARGEGADPEAEASAGERSPDRVARPGFTPIEDAKATIQASLVGYNRTNHVGFASRTCADDVTNEARSPGSKQMIATLVVLSLLTFQPAGPSPSIVFVCEHGAAKSVIATAYFNKLSGERGLPYRATFRGTSPQDELSVRAVAGLKEDGVAIPTGKPTAISDVDVAQATHIFAIGCTLPDMARRSGKADDWSDVPDDKGYGPMRDAIVRHVRDLLDRLAAAPRRRPQ